MAKHITASEASVIAEMIMNSKCEINWMIVVQMAQQTTGRTIPRQTLDRNHQIRSAWDCKKKSIKSTEVVIEDTTLSRLRAENDKLSATLNQLIEERITIIYNAINFGLTEDKLLRPIPIIKRSRNT